VNAVSLEKDKDQTVLRTQHVMYSESFFLQNFKQDALCKRLG